MDRRVMARLGLTLNRAKTRCAMRGRSDSTFWATASDRTATGRTAAGTGGQPVAEERAAYEGQGGGDSGAGNMGPWEEVRDTLNRLLRGWAATSALARHYVAYRAVETSSV